MFESFIITLREGAEAALAVGLIVITLRKSGRSALFPWVLGGLSLAILGSVIGAWGLSKLPINQELFEGSLMLAAAFLVGTTVVWMWRTARRFSEQLRAKVESLTDASASERAWSNWQAGAGLAAFTFLMVFREGVETAVFL
ncbi:MAG TPA: FTR1 family protein, partial [Alphaproteobacteria bacterium]|nr:FTR1 family protein [Alphaproteobacteria bacterium]